MRYFLLTLLALTMHESFAADCVTTDITPGGSYTCDNLYINTPLNLSAASGAPLEIVVLGKVEINANINLNGGDGLRLTTDNTQGAFGGPGASGGGGISGTDGEPGSDFTLSDGGAGVNNGVCNPGGGGGGGVDDAGSNGFRCNPSDTEGIGGIASGFPATFRGGYGGGAGASFNTGPSIYDLGGGGGGGGGLHINASGVINIKNGVRISARGGRGGNANNLGGAGGGGGGGVIWLESAVAINNAGIFDVRGGEGGVNTRSSSPRGARGGRGGNGIYRLEIAGDIISTGSGLADFSSKFTSEISCGSIATTKPNEKLNLALQLIAGFVLAFILSGSRKFLKLSSKT